VLPIQIAVLFGVTVSVVLHLYKTSLDIQLVELDVSEDGSIRERMPPAILPSDRVTLLDSTGAHSLLQHQPSGSPSGSKAVETRCTDIAPPWAPRTGQHVPQGAWTLWQELQSNGGTLVLTGVSDPLKVQLGRSKYWEVIGTHNIFLARDEVGSSTVEAFKRANDWLERRE
jgi:hypothetical protein